MEEPHSPNPRSALNVAERLVIKVGTGVLTTAEGRLDGALIDSLAEQIEELHSRGKEVVLVSSGAICAGWHELAMESRPLALPDLQAAAAVGQGVLINIYNRSFARYGRRVGQILLTRQDFDDRRRYLNARNTIRALLARGIVPIINENDTVSVEEITFSDNDLLSAFVTNLVHAQLLILLSVVDGLYAGKPTANSKPEVISAVSEITDNIKDLAYGESSSEGLGGMKSKLQAVHIATSAGEAAIIANGKTKDVIVRLMDGEPLGTLFVPQGDKMASRKRWIAFTASPRGEIHVDEGAKQALVQRGKSLLATGISTVAGRSENGDIVNVAGPDGIAFARGLCNYSAEETRRIKGLKTSQIAPILGAKLYDEIIHRDNMVLL